MLKPLLAVCSILFAPAAISAEGSPHVLVSIQPIHSLVAGIMQGVATPQRLLAGNQSPHHFSLRPSQAQDLAHAQLVIWVGPEMESALARPLGQRELPTLTLLDTPLPALLPSSRLDAPEGAHPHVGEEPGERDGHIWLDPRNAVQITHTIAEKLARLDPEHAALYHENATHLAEHLVALDAELEAILAPMHERSFVVFHDSLRYLQRRYGLRNTIAVAVDPERPPGARRVREVRNWIRSERPACIFGEPQFPPRLIEVLTEGTETNTSVLDPLGSQLAPGSGAYFQLMRELARGIAECLAGSPAGQKEIRP